MKIDLRERQDLVHGAREVVPTERGVWMRRLTDEAHALYAISEARAIRCRCGAGVRICFVSDTRAVALTVGLGRGEARPVYAADVVVDRDWRHPRTFGAEAAGRDYEARVEAPGPGAHRYEIHLPHLCEAEVLSLEVDDGASVSEAPFAGRPIAFIGDSITQGMTSTSPTRCYATMVGEALDRDYVNLSVGGAVMLAGIGKAALDYRWGTAFVAFGVNDWAWNRPLAEFAEDTRGMLRHLASRDGAEIRILTPLPFVRPGENSHSEPLDAYRDCIRAVAAEFPKVQVIDGLGLVSPDPALFVDGLHPNDDGMRTMAAQLLRQLEI